MFNSFNSMSPYGDSGYSQGYNSPFDTMSPYNNSLLGSGLNSMNSYGSGGMYGSDYGYGGLNRFGSGHGMGMGMGMGGGLYGQYGQSPNPIMRGFQDYLMTTSRVSELMQTSMQGVAMTIQSAFQLAQTGALLQQQHSSLSKNDIPASTDQTTDSLTISSNSPNGTKQIGNSADATTAVVHHTPQLQPLDPHQLHLSLTVLQPSTFFHKVFKFFDYLDFLLTFLPTPPKLIRFISLSILDTVWNFYRRVNHLYNFSTSTQFNYISLYSLYLQYQLFCEAQNKASTNQTTSDLSHELFSLHSYSELEMLSTHSIIARQFIPLSKHIKSQHFKKLSQQSSTPLNNSDDDKLNSLTPLPIQQQSPIITILADHYRSYYSTQSQQTKQNERLRTITYHIMQSQRPSKLWWLIGILFVSLGVHATIQLLKILKEFAQFLFPSIFGSKYPPGSTPHARFVSALEQRELQQRWKLLSTEHNPHNTELNVPQDLYPQSTHPIPQNLDQVWANISSPFSSSLPSQLSSTMPSQLQSHLLPNSNPTFPRSEQLQQSLQQSQQNSSVQSMQQPLQPQFDPMTGVPLHHAPLNTNINQNQNPYNQFNNHSTYSNNSLYQSDPMGMNGINGINGMNGMNGMNNTNGMHGMNPNHQRSAVSSTLSTLITTSLIAGTGYLVYKAWSIASNEMKKYQEEKERFEANPPTPSAPNNPTLGLPQNNLQSQQQPLYAVNGFQPQRFGLPQLGGYGNSLMNPLGTPGMMGSSMYGNSMGGMYGGFGY